MDGMGIVAVLVAGLATWVLGAAWYMAFARPWMAVSGVPTRDGRPANASNPVPFGVSALLLLALAGMMRHILIRSGIDTPGAAALVGAGLGAFIASPWIVMANLYAMRPVTLSLIDAGYATLGCTLCAVVLVLF
jgi:hypothetical protein